MTGLQLVLSCIMGFFVPGLGQVYQTQFFPDRALYAFRAIACAWLPMYLCGLGIGTIGIVWLIAFIECVMWAFAQKPLPVPVLRAAVVVLLVLTCVGTSFGALTEEPCCKMPNAVDARRCECGCKECGFGRCQRRGKKCCKHCTCLKRRKDSPFQLVGYGGLEDVEEEEMYFDSTPEVKPTVSIQSKDVDFAKPPKALLPGLEKSKFKAPDKNAMCEPGSACALNKAAGQPCSLCQTKGQQTYGVSRPRWSWGRRWCRSCR